MPIENIVEAGLLLFVLLNPFLLSIYLLDLIEGLPGDRFRSVLIRGALISTVVFVLFAWAGDAIFARVLQVRFAAFLMFGGIVFLIVGIRYVMVGSEAIRSLRGSPEHVAGSIAMPFMIGPGTVSASILAGTRLPLLWACLAIASAIFATVTCVLLLKALYERFSERYRSLVNHYVDITGRVSALVIGTLAVDMILRGIELWVRCAPASG